MSIEIGDRVEVRTPIAGVRVTALVEAVEPDPNFGMVYLVNWGTDDGQSFWTSRVGVRVVERCR